MNYHYRMSLARRFAFFFVILFLMMSFDTRGHISSSNTTAPWFRKWSRSATWHLLEKTKPRFDTHHPQGLAKVGDFFYLSSVEVIQKSLSIPCLDDDLPPMPGRGIGHFFQFDRSGRLLRKMTLGDETAFHPGGIDYDGKWFWIPVSEYQPRSRTIIYRVDPVTWKAEPVFRVPDHIGSLVYNRQSKTLVGINWNSEEFYEWTPEGHPLRRVKNSYRNLDYQDCKYVGEDSMLCAGRRNDDGGVILVDLKNFQKVHDISCNPASSGQILMTRNPMAVEKAGRDFKYYFLPEDHDSTLYVYQLQ